MRSQSAFSLALAALVATAYAAPLNAPSGLLETRAPIVDVGKDYKDKRAQANPLVGLSGLLGGGAPGVW